MSPPKRKRDTVPPRAAWWILLDPQAAFSGVRDKPRAWIVVVMLAFALVPPVAFLTRADPAAVVLKELKHSGKLESIPADKRDDVVHMGAKAMATLLPVGALGKRIALIAIVALLGPVLLRGTRPALTRRACVVAVALATAPLAAHDVLTALAFLTHDPGDLDAQNAVWSNPAAGFGIEARTGVQALLHQLDFFDLWTCALMGLGLRVVAESKSSAPYVLAFGIQAVVTLVVVIGAFAMGGH